MNKELCGSALLWSLVVCASGASFATDTGIQVDLEGLVLSSAGTGEGDLIVKYGTTDVLSANKLDRFDWAPGGRLSVVVPGNGELAGYKLQFSGMYSGRLTSQWNYFDVDGPIGDRFSAAYDSDYRGALISGPDNPDFRNSDSAYAFFYDYQRELWGGELNLQRETEFYGLTVLGGLRYIGQRNKLGSVLYDDEADYLGTRNHIDRVKLTTNNHIFGAQFGVEGAYEVAEKVYLGGRASVGAGLNRIDFSSRLTSDNNSAVDIRKKEGLNHFAAFVEVAPKLTYQFSERLAFNVGGYAMLLNGVSDGTEEYHRVGLPDYDVLEGDDTLLFYGFSAGASIRF
ncbi:hypothetical protein PSE_3820 [Pseudovibrio sp. FO-BEG1]|uniref:hypothetical protein n=1 Tax=Pseudovibrio sp. (strain FO-BEG1) TaxID=911045 RepID=UPI000238C2DB|nr:hypothetical protein [Pseudovibrio sp. FO-BEG1]AEV38324.1 hypothetical protein PSE_3820 [Pseudovibrio sp. FO-BEG1]